MSRRSAGLRWIGCGLLWVAAVAATGCARRERAAPHPGVALPRRPLTEKVAARMASLSDAYGRGDVPWLLAQVDPKYRLGRCLLGREVTSELAGRRNAVLTFIPDRIREDVNRVEARCRWEKTYVILATGQRVRERGHCVLVFRREDPMRLMDVRGDLPFGAG